MARSSTERTAYGNARLSAQRRVIADTAATLERAFTVEDLADSVRARDASIGLATVYRAVNALEAASSMERVGERGGSTLYAYCRHGGHHHHLVCTECGRVEHAPCLLGESAVAEVSAGGFRITGHEMKLFGLCPSCAGPGTGG